jgi:hypothetical protein
MFWKLLNSLKPEMKNSSDSCIDLATWHTHFKNINSIPQCQTQLVAKLNDMLKGLDNEPVIKNTVKQFTQTTINSYTPIIIWI